MIKSYVFHLPKNSKEKIINAFNLKKIASSDTTDIFQNDDMRFSVEKKVIRVLLFDKNNVILLEKLRNYFYDEEYKL